MLLFYHCEHTVTQVPVYHLLDAGHEGFRRQTHYERFAKYGGKLEPNWMEMGDNVDLIFREFVVFWKGSAHRVPNFTGLKAWTGLQSRWAASVCHPSAKGHFVRELFTLTLKKVAGRNGRTDPEEPRRFSSVFPNFDAGTDYNRNHQAVLDSNRFKKRAIVKWHTDSRALLSTSLKHLYVHFVVPACSFFVRKKCEDFFAAESCKH